MTHGIKGEWLNADGSPADPGNCLSLDHTVSTVEIDIRHLGGFLDLDRLKRLIEAELEVTCITPTRRRHYARPRVTLTPAP